MLLWANKLQIDAPAELIPFRERMMARPAVQKAMHNEGLI
jgi:glutathione S-transferase